MSEEVDEGRILRENLFTGDLLQLPAPEEGAAEFLPRWFTGTLPALIYPPLSERGIQEGDSVDLQVSPYNLYYGALRELAETADAERGVSLRQLALEWNPNAALEVTELARTHLNADVETALLHYELAMELDENLYEAVQDAGMCQFALSTDENEDRAERLEAAEELFRRAIEIRPEEGLSWWSLARALHDRGADDEAGALLMRFLNEHPEGNNREMVEAALQGGFEAAEVSEEQAVFAQAQALAFNGQPEQAVELLTPLSEQFPDAGEIWFVLGAAQRRAGHHDEAERCLRRASRLAPQEPFVWWELSGTCADAGEWRAAEDAIHKALEIDADNPQFLCDLGRIRAALGDPEGAREAAERALELVPDDAEIRKVAVELGVEA